MRRPRRIFRASSLAAPPAAPVLLRPTLLAGLTAILAAGGTMLLGRPTDLFGHATAPSGTITAEAAAVAVVDGDTLRLHDTVLRLQGVEAPRRGAACRGSDGAAFDCGAAAAAALGRLVFKQTVSCRLNGHDPRGLPQAQCAAEATEINRALVLAGWAKADSGTQDLAAAEQQARDAQRGVWADRTNQAF